MKFYLIGGVLLICQFVYYNKIIKEKNNKISILKLINDLLSVHNNELREKNDKFLRNSFNSEDDEDDILII